MVDLGSAIRNDNGTVTIPDKMLHFILNFNETCLSVDGTQERRGGQPEITLHDPRLPFNGKRANKDSLTVMLVCGSTATSEALPPDFQFQTKATTEERERLRNDVFKYCPQVYGQFGTESETLWDCLFGLNTKGVMDDCEFEQYIPNSILPLYPNMCNRPGKRLLLKCESGPGRLQIELLAKFVPLHTKHYSGNAGDGSNVWPIQKPIQEKS